MGRGATTARTNVSCRPTWPSRPSCRRPWLPTTSVPPLSSFHLPPISQLTTHDRTRTTAHAHANEGCDVDSTNATGIPEAVKAAQAAGTTNLLVRSLRNVRGMGSRLTAARSVFNARCGDCRFGTEYVCRKRRQGPRGHHAARHAGPPHQVHRRHQHTHCTARHTTRHTTHTTRHTTRTTRHATRCTRELKIPSCARSW
jgi:hypothetical protein